MCRMGALCSLITRMISFAVVILIIAALFHTYIKLDQEINSTKEEISRINANIVSMKRDIETQDMRLAGFSTREYIERQIAHFNLPLVELRQDQQIRVKVFNDAQLAKIYSPRNRMRQNASVSRPLGKNQSRRGFRR